MGGDKKQPAAIRLQALRTILPYIYAPMPVETHNTHAHLHADVDQSVLVQAIVDRLERLAPSSEPTIDLAPAEVVATLPMPDEAINVPRKKTSTRRVGSTAPVASSEPARAAAPANAAPVATEAEAA